MPNIDDLLKAMGRFGLSAEERQKKADYLMHLTQVNELAKAFNASVKKLKEQPDSYSALEAELIQPFEEYFNGEIVKSFISKYPKDAVMVQYNAVPGYISELKRDLKTFVNAKKEEKEGRKSLVTTLNIQRVLKMMPSYFNLITEKVQTILSFLSSEVEPLKSDPAFYKQLYVIAFGVYQGK